ncbi:MAG TPA: hypothetical protein VF516_00215 [Kofleriaceae bacterium]
MALGYRIADGYMRVDADHSPADRSLAGFFRAADGRLRDMRGRFAAEGQLAGQEYTKRFQEAAKNQKQSGFEGFARKLLGRFGALGKAAGGLLANKMVLAAVAGLGALPTAIAAVGQAVGGLLNVAGAGAALAPAGIAAAAFSLITLKVALSGVGAAFKAGLSGDAEKFAEALKKLAPAAQEAVKQLVALAPAARQLKQTVQNSLFAPWLDDIKPLASIYLPILTQEMTWLAAAAGMAFHHVLELFETPAAAQQFHDMLTGFVQAFSNVAAGLPGIVSGFFQLASAGSLFLGRFTEGFAGLTQRFAEWATAFTQSGRFDAFVEHALETLGGLSRALQDIVGIFQSFNRAAQAVVGGGLFQALGQILDMVNRFFQSVQGQEVLTALLTKLQTLGGIVMDLVSGALPGLLSLSGALLEGLQALAPVAGPVGEALGAALSALAPILPVLGSLLAPVLKLAAGALQSLATVLAPVIQLFSELATQALPLLMPLIDELVANALPMAAALATELYNAFAPLVPVLLEVYHAIADGLMAALPDLLETNKELIPVVGEIAKIFADTWLSVLQELRPHIPIIIQFFVALLKVSMAIGLTYLKIIPYVATFASWFIKAAAWVAGFVLTIIEIPTHLRAIIGVLKEWVSGAVSAVGDFFGMIGGWISQAAQWFADLPGKIIGFLQQIPQAVRDALSAAFDAFFYWTGFIAAKVVEFVQSIPLRIAMMWQTIKTTFMDGVSAVGNFFAELPVKAEFFFSDMYNKVTTWVVNTYNSVGQWLGSLPTRAGNALSSLWSSIRGAFDTATTNVRKAIGELIDGAVTLAKSLPGKIRDAVGNLGHLLYDAGRDIVHGLIDGFNSMIDWAKNLVGNAMKKIKDGAKAAIGSNSPSKAFRDEVGKTIPQGIAAGIRAGMPDLERYLTMRVAALPGMSSANVNVAAPNVAVGAPVVVVTLDGEQIAANISIQPARVAATAAEGFRQRNFLNTGRAVTA